MRFYKLDDVPVGRDDQVFKESPIINAVLALFLFGIAIGVLALGVTKWHPTSWVPFLVAGVFALFGLVPLGNFRASLKPSNWLMRCQLSGVILKYRAYENWRLPADTLQAVGLEYGEIAWAKLVKERRKSPNMDGKAGAQIQYFTYINLGMVKPDLSELEANLRAERALRPAGGLKVVTIDYPVQVRPGGVVEIRWGSGIRPSAQKALEVLGRRVKILESEHRETDFTYKPGDSAEEKKARIIALALSGDQFGAIRLARQAYGCSLSRAQEIVNDLSPDADEKSGP